MITFQSESFMACLPEMVGLFDLHYKELAMNQDKVPLAPAYDKYEAMEKADMLILVTMRVDGVVQGYYIGFISPSMHYTTCKECLMDILWIHPDHRADGMLGIKLFRAVEPELKKCGVQRWIVGEKLKAPIGAIFRRVGFAPFETYWTKWIGE